MEPEAVNGSNQDHVHFPPRLPQFKNSVKVLTLENICKKNVKLRIYTLISNTNDQTVFKFQNSIVIISQQGEEVKLNHNQFQKCLHILQDSKLNQQC